MDNKEEILRLLDEFGRKPTEKVPPILEQYLSKIATTGETLFPWPKLKPLFVHKLDEVMKTFFEQVPMDNLTPRGPNVENVGFEEMRTRLLNAVDTFTNAPFTIQRLCELVTNPTKHYKRTDKFLRGIEKNVNVVSTVDPFGVKIVSESKTLVNGMDTNGYENNKHSSETTQLIPFLPPPPPSSPSAGSPSTSADSSPTSTWYQSQAAYSPTSPYINAWPENFPGAGASGEPDSTRHEYMSQEVSQAVMVEGAIWQDPQTQHLPQEATKDGAMEAEDHSADTAAAPSTNDVSEQQNTTAAKTQNVSQGDSGEAFVQEEKGFVPTADEHSTADSQQQPEQMDTSSDSTVDSQSQSEQNEAKMLEPTSLESSKLTDEPKNSEPDTGISEEASTKPEEKVLVESSVPSKEPEKEPAPVTTTSHTLTRPEPDLTMRQDSSGFDTPVTPDIELPTSMAADQSDSISQESSQSEVPISCLPSETQKPETPETTSPQPETCTEKQETEPVKSDTESDTSMDSSPSCKRLKLDHDDHTAPSEPLPSEIPPVDSTLPQDTSQEHTDTQTDGQSEPSGQCDQSQDSLQASSEEDKESTQEEAMDAE